MDSYTLKKRQEDKICALALNDAGGQKIQNVNQRRCELMKEQKEMANVLRQKVGHDMAAQYINVKAGQVAVQKSRNFGPVPYKYVQPPSESSNEGIHHHVQNVLRISNELDSLQHEAKQLEKAHALAQVKDKDTAQVDSMSAWFARYGEPKRQSHPVEKARSCIMKPRRVPGLGQSAALTLRKGHLIK
ncbi:unnamed protein product [Polarella glacialis]|uniref:Uncharacterized protein n=1 Tax=Polarella glacialis TaxID=89957 RepID=A0A813KU71_POLGL|nr:unnamed protein product [Polarella glacialis]CAE8597481.1 unnamed protein product [Polarella glacialis]CAE8708438.1 unnamed protein product [Polarella glacialis]CAE8739087.1 unnamed protein product [Polarella glacialis]